MTELEWMQLRCFIDNQRLRLDEVIAAILYHQKLTAIVDKLEEEKKHGKKD